MFNKLRSKQNHNLHNTVKLYYAVAPTKRYKGNVNYDITQLSKSFLGRHLQKMCPLATEMPGVLFHPLPSASGHITFQGFPVTPWQTFWYVALKAMKYIYYVTTIHEYFEIKNASLHIRLNPFDIFIATVLRKECVFLVLFLFLF